MLFVLNIEGFILIPRVHLGYISRRDVHVFALKQSETIDNRPSFYLTPRLPGPARSRPPNFYFLLPQSGNIVDLTRRYKLISLVHKHIAYIPCFCKNKPAF